MDNNQNAGGILSDAHIAQFDSGPSPLEDRDIALMDQTSAAKAAMAPPDPRIEIQQRYQGERQKMDKMYQGLAKANKIAMYGVPPGVLTDSQQASYNHHLQQLGAREQQELSMVPPTPPPPSPAPAGAPPAPPIAMADGATVQGPVPALVGEAGNELLLHQDGSQELLDHPQYRELGTNGTDQVIPFTRPGGGKEVLRGSSSIPLNDEGHQMAIVLARDYAGAFDQLHTSPLVRAMQTTQPILQTNPQARFQVNDGLRDMGLGQLEGQEVTRPAIERLNHAILRTPGVPFQGQGPNSTQPGDSLQSFQGRVIPTIQSQMAELDQNPDLAIGDVTHNRVLRMIKGHEAMGFPPDGGIDTAPLIDYQGTDVSDPGGVERLARSASGKWAITKVKGKPPRATSGKVKGGIYLIRHGKTDANASGNTAGALKKSPSAPAGRNPAPKFK